MSFTASRRKPPRSAASHNLLKTCPSLARWSGSRGARRRRRKAEPSGGIVQEFRRYPRNARNAAEIHGFFAAVPEVRIHLPPAESPQTFGSCSRRRRIAFTRAYRIGSSSGIPSRLLAKKTRHRLGVGTPLVELVHSLAAR